MTSLARSLSTEPNIEENVAHPKYLIKKLLLLSQALGLLQGLETLPGF